MVSHQGPLQEPTTSSDIDQWPHHAVEPFPGRATFATVLCTNGRVRQRRDHWSYTTSPNQ
jgi:hypothetical protein